jgi:hypothetical protein
MMTGAEEGNEIFNLSILASIGNAEKYFSSQFLIDICKLKPHNIRFT